MNIPIWKCTLVRESTFSAGPGSVETAAEAAAIFQEYLRGADRENFVVLLLNAKSRPIGINTVSVGILDMSLVHPREVFKPAILAGACCIMIAHNHPSGDPEPSPEDMETTRRLIQAGDLLGIPVLDHIIVGDTCYSMREHGRFYT